jgi:hypothetical protein
MTEPKPLIEGKEPIYHVVVTPERFGITKVGARLQDMADEYAIVADEKANAGLIIYGKYNGVWRPNPWSTRFLIKDLLEKLNIKINNQ